MQECTKCNTKLPINFFSFRNKKTNTKHHICKICQKGYADKFYTKNKETHKEKNKAILYGKIKKNTEVINKYKDAPCKDCNIRYPPYVMDFDHLSSITKISNISYMRSRRNVEEILKEISKCELVCSNCHRERTHNSGKRIK